MEIEIILDKHCIEGATKAKYNQAVSDYFKSNGDVDLLEKTIEGLKYFLEKADFRELRHMYPVLDANTNAKVILVVKESEGLMLCFENKELCF